jgi:glutamine amidotransferase
MLRGAALSEIVVVDHGLSNARSMINALTKVARTTQRVRLTRDPAAIADAERVVLPGVGGFGEVRRQLDANGLTPALEKFRATGRPLLGVCVGMQLMADVGLEFEATPGLGWISGSVEKLSVQQGMKLPHFGWSRVAHVGGALFDGLPSGSQFYFVHSYALSCTHPADVVATAEYSAPFAAVVKKGSLIGTQFHPEKSDIAGLKLLANFCRWDN